MLISHTMKTRPPPCPFYPPRRCPDPEEGRPITCPSIEQISARTGHNPSHKRAENYSNHRFQSSNCDASTSNMHATLTLRSCRRNLLSPYYESRKNDYRSPLLVVTARSGHGDNSHPSRVTLPGHQARNTTKKE